MIDHEIHNNSPTSKSSAISNRKPLHLPFTMTPTSQSVIPNRKPLHGLVYEYDFLSAPLRMTSYIPGGQAIDDPLPELLLAGLGAPQTLQEFVELDHAAGRHAERVSGAANDPDELVVIRLRDVVHPLVRTLNKPEKCNTR